MTNIADTIAAVATAPGLGGIGIVRISGPRSVAITQTFFRPHGSNHTPPQTVIPRQPAEFQHRRLHHGYIVIPGDDRVVDEVLVAFMRAPNSYTREDVIEIQSHAGSAVLQSILGLVIDAGARLADPGEFTRRAFLNGRIDLTQAEAVADLISAKTETAMRLATRQLTGGMQERVGRIRRHLQRAAGHLEAMIEFPEEMADESEERSAFYTDAETAFQEIDALMRAYGDNHLYRDGIQVSVVGRPNVGKSSLMNALLEKERAIVTALPGTTRDLIIDTFQVDGIPIQITDTAGMRHSEDMIEKIGIRKTEESIASAHLILFVVDAADMDHREDQRLFAQLRDKMVLLVVNKRDLVDQQATIPRWIDSETPHVSISAKYHENLTALKKQVVVLITKGHLGTLNEEIVPNLRQERALKEARADLSNALEACQSGESEEFIVYHLQRALNRIGTITGETHTEDLLDIIFERFCIGK